MVLSGTFKLFVQTSLAENKVHEGWGTILGIKTQGQHLLQNPCVSPSHVLLSCQQACSELTSEKRVGTVVLGVDHDTGQDVAPPTHFFPPETVLGCHQLPCWENLVFSSLVHKSLQH